MDWVVTIPKTTKWSEYLRELDAVKDGSLMMNYKTRYFPKDMTPGDRCFIVWNGRVRGWMSIVNLAELKEWKCQTTGTTWLAGKYIQRSGPFHCVDGPEMKGFRGIRRYEDNEEDQKKNQED